jgi:DNA-binding MarR family transcriptional regulator
MRRCKALNNYFEKIIDHLNIDDMSVLGVLYDKEATSKFKSLTANEIMDVSGITNFKFKKAITRLEALKFIEISTDSKVKAFYINEFGSYAVNKTLEGEEVEC